VLDKAGVTWKIYQDLAGATFAPDFGDGTGNNFAGNYTDNSLLYFAQYAWASPGNPLFDNACTGTQLVNTQPSASAPAPAWKAWALSQFDQLRADVQSGKLPQVSWIVAPAGYTEHSDYPINYGAWYISQVLDILVSNPEVFSKTVFIINYDEADGSFDHVVPPSPPAVPTSPDSGGSTVDYHNEIVTTSTPNGPIGLGDSRAVHRDLALEQGRLRELASLRSHFDDPVHREALRSLREKHFALAPYCLRRPDFGV
jgi:phospholipase C